MPHYIGKNAHSLIKNAVFSVNKRKGITSAKTLEIIKTNLSNESSKKEKLTIPLTAGHGGTLDSSATGVLVVGLCLGCKSLSDFLHGGKSYEVTGKFGSATDTFNDCGEVTHTAPYSHITVEKLNETLKSFTGTILQKPPIYSALKHNGVRLSDLARNNIEVETKCREVECKNLKLCWFYPPYFNLKLTTSSGFYVRSLVHDLGITLGSYAHITELVRTRQGNFLLDNSLDANTLSISTILDAINSHSKEPLFKRKRLFERTI